MENFFYVYVLNLNNNKFYIGYTKNLKRRLKEHNRGESKYTKTKRPLNLVYFEGYVNLDDAKGRERFLKGGSGHKYLKKQLRNFLK